MILKNAISVKTLSATDNINKNQLRGGTSEAANCAIGMQDINVSDYTALDRNCTIGQGTLSHTCSLKGEDEFAAKCGLLTE